MNIIEKAGNRVKCINEVAGDEGNWERITVTVDSGAVNSFGPPTMVTGIKIGDTPASRAGLKDRAANGGMGASIDDQGENIVQAVTK